MTRPVSSATTCTVIPETHLPLPARRDPLAQAIEQHTRDRAVNSRLVRGDVAAKPPARDPRAKSLTGGYSHSSPPAPEPTADRAATGRAARPRPLGFGTEQRRPAVAAPAATAAPAAPATDPSPRLRRRFARP